MIKLMMKLINIKIMAKNRGGNQRDGGISSLSKVDKVKCLKLYASFGRGFVM